MGFHDESGREHGFQHFRASRQRVQMAAQVAVEVMMVFRRHVFIARADIGQMDLAKDTLFHKPADAPVNSRDAQGGMHMPSPLEYFSGRYRMAGCHENLQDSFRRAGFPFLAGRFFHSIHGCVCFLISNIPSVGV